MTNTVTLDKRRDSGIELFRIITMFIIVSHHYVVNSGLLDLINSNPRLTANSIFLLLFGWGGKTGINCFVMITGYFMCKSKLTLRKVLKLYLEVEFYKIILCIIFIFAGYQELSIKVLIKTLFPFYGIGTGFATSFLAFYLFIPFLNILISGMNEKQHRYLIVLCIALYTIIPTFAFASVTMGYVVWFMVIYIVASYLRLYPFKGCESKKLWGFLTLGSLVLSWASVLCCAWLHKNYDLLNTYYFVQDSYKPLALVTAVCAFMFFKNLNIGYSKMINKIAASAFGVLLIHAGSNAMLQWLWKDTLKNVDFYNSQFLVLHALGSVITIYIICTLIDMLRIKFAEKPVFGAFDKWMSKVGERHE